MQNCARPWSIRRRPRKCLVSSAARPPTCSRSSTLSSRARRGFVGSMTWCCDSAKEKVMVARAHFGPIPSMALEMSIDEPRFRWMREHGTLHIPDVRAQNDFPTLGSFSGFRTFLGVPLRQQGEFIGVLTARRNEVHPFTPAQIKLLETFADQAVIALKTCGCSKNSKRHWSSKRRRAKSWASSPAHRRTFSRCLMRLPRARLGCAGPMTRRFAWSKVMRCSGGALRNNTTPSPVRGEAWDGAQLATKLCSSAGRSIFQTFRRRRRVSRTART